MLLGLMFFPWSVKSEIVLKNSGKQEIQREGGMRFVLDRSRSDNDARITIASSEFTKTSVLVIKGEVKNRGKSILKYPRLFFEAYGADKEEVCGFVAHMTNIMPGKTLTFHESRKCGKGTPVLVKYFLVAK